MPDREFLMWLHERLEHVHKESPCVDYMHKLRAIIKATDPSMVTKNLGSHNSLEALKANMLLNVEGGFCEKKESLDNHGRRPVQTG